MPSIPAAWSTNSFYPKQKTAINRRLQTVARKAEPVRSARFIALSWVQVKVQAQKTAINRRLRTVARKAEPVRSARFIALSGAVEVRNGDKSPTTNGCSAQNTAQQAINRRLQTVARKAEPVRSARFIALVLAGVKVQAQKTAINRRLQTVARKAEPVRSARFIALVLAGSESKVVRHRKRR